MENGLKNNILIFSVGLVIGGIVSALVVKNRYEKRYEGLFYEEVSDDRKDDSMLFKEDTTGEKGTPKEDSKVLILPNKRYEKIVKNYNGIPAPTGTLAHDDEEETVAGCYPCGEPREQEVHVITVEEFSEECTHYDKLTISYYEDDDVLADENEEVISDVESIIGEDALNSFGEGSDDPEIVYVRNNRLQIDYEVIRLSKSYSETVLGITPDDRRRTSRRRDGDEE